MRRLLLIVARQGIVALRILAASGRGETPGAWGAAIAGFAGLLVLVVVPTAGAQTLAAAVLPSSRSVLVGTPATAFATIINAGSFTATNCRISPPTGLPATFAFQTTDPTTNAVTGAANTPVDIAAGAAQSFVFAFTPMAAFSPTEVALTFACDNAGPAPVTAGLNTLLLSASVTPVPDVVALAATLSNDGIVDVPGVTGATSFAVATVNVGAAGAVTVSADTGAAALAVTVLVCQTNSSTGACLLTPAASVAVQIGAGATPTFGVFVTGRGAIGFDPAANRVFIRFVSGGITRGSTGVALRTGSSVVLIVARQLPDAEVGRTYLFSFCTPTPSGVNDLCSGPFTPSTNPTGGQPPYHFQLDPGGFPPFGISLNLNGRLEGTPTTAGTRTFRVCAVDLAGFQSCTTVTLTVKAATRVFAGTFSGTFSGTFASTNCTFGGTHSGTLRLTLVDSANGTVSGTATADAGTDVFVVAGSTCSTSARSATVGGTVSGSTGSVTASLSETDPEPGRMTISFTGTRTATSVSGTVTVSNEFRGFTNGVQVSATRLSSSVPATLALQ